MHLGIIGSANVEYFADVLNVHALSVRFDMC